MKLTTTIKGKIADARADLLAILDELEEIKSDMEDKAGDEEEGSTFRESILSDIEDVEEFARTIVEASDLLASVT